MDGGALTSFNLQLRRDLEAVAGRRCGASLEQLTQLINNGSKLNETLLSSPPLSLSLSPQVVAFVHFFFISNAMLGSWGHGAYEFYNFLFIISLFWTIHSKDSVEAVQTVSAQYDHDDPRHHLPSLFLSLSHTLLNHRNINSGCYQSAARIYIKPRVQIRHLPPPLTLNLLLAISKNTLE